MAGGDLLLPGYLMPEMFQFQRMLTCSNLIYEVFKFPETIITRNSLSERCHPAAFINRPTDDHTAFFAGRSKIALLHELMMVCNIYLFFKQKSSCSTHFIAFCPFKSFDIFK
jgi:hypothetical protein